MTETVLSLWRGRITVFPTPQRIATEVADRHDLTLSQLLLCGRAPRYAHARQEAMWEIRQRTTLSLPAIGRFFGLDHTTILHGIRRQEERWQDRKAIAA